MLRLIVPEKELYDERTGLFVHTKKQVLQLEHSLVSLSKWESKWHKPFLSKNEKSGEEMLDYIRCMTITQNVPDEVYFALDTNELMKINDYLNDSMTATTITKQQGKSRGEIITSEIIYYWMISLQIPFECEKWNLNRLLTLIEVCNIKNSPGKKMSKSEIMRRNRTLNAARKQQMHTRG